MHSSNDILSIDLEPEYIIVHDRRKLDLISSLPSSSHSPILKLLKITCSYCVPLIRNNVSRVHRWKDQPNPICLKYFAFNRGSRNFHFFSHKIGLNFPFFTINGTMLNIKCPIVHRSRKHKACPEMSHIETHLFSICPKPVLLNAQPTFQRQNIFQILATQRNQLLPHCLIDTYFL